MLPQLLAKFLSNPGTRVMTFNLEQEEEKEYDMFGPLLPGKVMKRIFERLDIYTFLAILPLISKSFNKACHDTPIPIYCLIDIGSSTEMISRFFMVTKKVALEPLPYNQILKFPAGYPLTKGLYHFSNSTHRDQLRVSLIDFVRTKKFSKNAKTFLEGKLNLPSEIKLPNNIWVLPMTNEEERNNTQPILIDHLDTPLEELYIRRNIKSMDETLINEKLTVDVLTSTRGSSFESDEVYSMIIRPSGLLDSHTYAKGFKSFSVQTFKSLRTLLLRNIALDEDALNFIGRHVLDLLLLEDCTPCGESLDLRAKVFNLKRLYIILKSAFGRSIIVPEEIEELVIQCPKSRRFADSMADSCSSKYTKVKAGIFEIHMEHCTRLKSM